jgi:hypothetical protein
MVEYFSIDQPRLNKKSMESNFSNNQDPRKNERVTGHDLKLVEDLMKSLAQIEYECYKD